MASPDTGPATNPLPAFIAALATPKPNFPTTTLKTPSLECTATYHYEEFQLSLSLLTAGSTYKVYKSLNPVVMASDLNIT